MAAASPARSFHEDASCSICGALFQDPVSIHCGHNFCRGCITRCWEGAHGGFSCPRCRETAPRRELRPNRELATLIAVARRLSLRAGGAGARLCAEHREALKLFCEEEQSPICLVCREGPAHRGHAVLPIEEAAEERKEKLQAHVQVLKDRREKLLGLKKAEEGKSLDLLDQVEAARQKVASQARELERAVAAQERLVLERLARLEQDIVGRREESIRRLRGDIASITEQIRELEERSRQPPCELLQDSSDLLSRLEKDGAQEPAEASPELGQKPSAAPSKSIALKEMLMECKVSLTLDPDTAHPRLVLCDERKSVSWGGTRRALPDNPERFDSSRCVLARGGFTTGRHYWEVALGQGQVWALGVAKASVRRKGRVSINPQEGIWAVGRCGSKSQALTAPPIPITLPAAPAVIGVYLDYEEGTVAFVDPRQDVPIFSHPPAAFAGEKILPLLCLGRGCQFTLSP